jgi:molecular chaperone DnaK (HSP70)
VEATVPLGIDFGTCLSSAAVVVDGEPRPVKEPQRQGYSLASAVYWDAEADTLLVGEAAEFARRQDPTCYDREFKRSLGKGAPHLLGSRTFETEDLVAAVLRQLAGEAARFLPGGGRPERAVLTVPSRYEEPRRECMREAARRAGLEAELLTEPVAAALHYERRCKEGVAEGEAVLLYDLGGGTFDAAVLAKRDGRFEELVPSDGLDEVGGSTFDAAIYNDLLTRSPAPLREALKRQGDPAALRLRQTVWAECRNLKHHLSVAPKGAVWLDHVQPPVHYALEAAQFEAAIRPDLDATVRVCQRLVARAGLPASRPPRLVMVGGSTRIPLVARVLREAFGREPERVDDPELAVCLGAALAAASQWAGGQAKQSERRYGKGYSIKRDPFRMGDDEKGGP